LFNAFAIERAAQGGRVTVQMMNVGGSALNPASYAKEDYISVLGSRRNDLYKSLRSANLSDEQAQTIINDQKRNAPSLYQTSPTTEKPAIESGTDEKGSFHWEYNEDRTKRRKVYG
jgi:hypothetical protein